MKPKVLSLSEVMSNEMEIESTETSVTYSDISFDGSEKDFDSHQRRNKWKCHIDEEQIRSKVVSNQLNKY